MRVHGAKLLLATDGEFRFAADNENAEVIFKNESDQPRKIRASFVKAGNGLQTERVLASQETWTIPATAK